MFSLFEAAGDPSWQSATAHLSTAMVGRGHRKVTSKSGADFRLLSSLAHSWHFTFSLLLVITLHLRRPCEECGPIWIVHSGPSWSTL